MNKHYWKKLSALAEQVLAQPTPPAPNSVPSPCVSVCVMHPQTGQCEGCLRTLQEIGEWSRLHDAGKRQVWQRIQMRVQSLVGG